MFENWPSKIPSGNWNLFRKTMRVDERQKLANSFAEKTRNSNSINWKSNDVESLKKEGIQFLDNLLTTEQCAEMYDYFYQQPCYDFYNSHEKFSIKNTPKHIRLGRHTLKTNLLAPNMVDIITNERLISMASEYLSAPATLSLMLPMWSFNNNETAKNINMQLFHRDCDDFKNLKLFVLLSDTEDKNGNQTYVKTSHVKQDLPLSLHQIKRYSDESVMTYFSKDDTINIHGKKGLTWFADTYGIHKGTPPNLTTSNRLLFQLQFTYSPVSIFNYKPAIFSRWEELSDLVKYSTRLYLRSPK